MIANEKDKKKFLNICTKITSIYNSFYLFKNGYCVGMDVEKPFIIQLDDTQVKYFIDTFGDFKLMRITNIRKYKKEPDKYFYIVKSKTEYDRVLDSLTRYLNIINQSDKWDKLILSPDEDKNAVIVNSILKQNDYIKFNPKSDFDGPDVILTKSLFPLVTEETWADLYYSSIKISDDLYALVFDFQFSLFRVYSVNYYVPVDDIDDNKEEE